MRQLRSVTKSLPATTAGAFDDSTVQPLCLGIAIAGMGHVLTNFA